MQFKNPVIITNSHRITSGFGLRVNPITGVKNSMHNGIDIVDTQGLQRTQDIWCIAIADLAVTVRSIEI